MDMLPWLVIDEQPVRIMTSTAPEEVTMQKFVIFGALTALFFVFTPSSREQDSGDVERLRKDNELLKKENELLKKEIELLKRDIELLKKGPQAQSDAAQDPDTEKREPRTKVTMKVDRAAGSGDVQVELVKCVRGEEPTLVTFTFVARWLAGRLRGEAIGLGGARVAVLVTADGQRVDGRATTFEGSIQLTREEPAKFQVSYTGVGPDVKEFAQVRLAFGVGLATTKIMFNNIKIETANSSDKGGSEKAGKAGRRGAKKGDR
jgi:hypothetical protein